MRGWLMLAALLLGYLGWAGGSNRDRAGRVPSAEPELVHTMEGPEGIPTPRP